MEAEMDCKRVQKLLPLGLGGDLAAGKQRAFDEHLKICLACYRRFARFREALAPLAELREHSAAIEAPALVGLHDAIMRDVRAGVPGPRAALSASPRRWLGRAAVAAGFLIALGAGGWLGKAWLGGGAGESPVRPVRPVAGNANLGHGATIGYGDEFGPIQVMPVSTQPHPGHVVPTAAPWTRSLPPVKRTKTSKDDF